MRAVAFGAGLVAALGMVSVAVAAMDDPDAPMATARYAAAADSTPALAPATPPPNSSAPTGPDPSANRAPRRFDMGVEDARANIEASNGQLTGLATNPGARPEVAARMTRYTGAVGRILQDQNLRRGFGALQALGDKARLFLFAGDQGGVWTYSFTRDQGGVKASGWATERADGTGGQRAGLAWQRGRTRLSLTGMERKFCQYGAEMKDRVLAMTLSFSPGWSTRRDRQRS